MIISEKVRAMSKAEKFHHFLKVLVDAESTDNARADALEYISKLMKGCPWTDIEKEFDVKVAYNTTVTPATITIKTDDIPEGITMDLVATDRDQFANATTQTAAAPRSMLDEEEKREINNLVNSK